MGELVGVFNHADCQFFDWEKRPRIYGNRMEIGLGNPIVAGGAYLSDYEIFRSSCMDTTLEGKIHGHPTLADGTPIKMCRLQYIMKDGTLIAEKDIAKPAEETVTYQPTIYRFCLR